MPKKREDRIKAILDFLNQEQGAPKEQEDETEEEKKKREEEELNFLFQ